MNKKALYFSILGLLSVAIVLCALFIFQDTEAATGQNVSRQEVIKYQSNLEKFKKDKTLDITWGETFSVGTIRELIKGAKDDQDFILHFGATESGRLNTSLEVAGKFTERGVCCPQRVMPLERAEKD